MDKRDGSMIHTVKKIQGIEAFYCSANFTLKSKKSYDSDVAKSAREFMATKQNDLALKLATYGYRGVNDVWPDYVGFCNSCIEHEQTAIFEWTSPVARIVLAYPKDELKLLHVRDNVTGDYKKRPFLEELARKYNVPMVDDRDDLIEMLRTEEGVLRYVEETEGVEGIVVQFENGNMVKIKTKWYMERHHKMTFVRMRDIVEMVLNESLDDLKAFYVGEGVDITEINEIEASVVNAIDEIIWEVNRIVGSAGLADRKSMAMKYGVQGENHPLFKLIMHKWEGKDPDYKGFYERNYLSSVPLRQLNMLQTIAEDE
jgi:RNA ligase